ncbi:hypothetical protein TWF106_001331 [Orbilia oligospora]|uniref:Uncharacterized protein n=1 Tax=Orbilia oligospora TaxID=2813651 RepID=A0A6G1MN24_ORBOL|nr:hypothetical protein TWF788_007256 [Orbilia oligospora]KAF3199084.1 hypothetical protein TWF679_001646 [Orbilia oligospora]KAF3226115.1 hypothetical protein TWF106_001331 [Orbilia oligospora]KAF3229862.1 hypothetical protein TWF191_000770 [Orbilia oligospora]KAF3264350.1 hypothetical protein TWF192_004038 [Orbilia oligospora]
MASGYYKYRCKNFYSHNCGNWVWVNNTACAECVAAGRDSLSLNSHRHHLAGMDFASSIEADPTCPTGPKLSSHNRMHDQDDEDFSDEAAVRPRRDPCSHFHSGYL